MKDTEINILEEIELNNPIFIEALPGIGHVGKLAADHIIDELDATKFAELYSYHFPPQVFVDEDGLVENMVNEFYYLKSQGEDNKDYIILVGNSQALSPEGQYQLSGEILDFVEKFGVKEMYTLGGLATGHPIEESRVFGAATDIEIIETLKELNIEIRSADGGIVGASGLLLGLGKLRNIKGACLMGETPGYFIDAEAAEAILDKLAIILNIEINTDKLDERAEETRKMISKAQKMEQEMMNKTLGSGEDDLRYIG
ncbi:proteasome assembly chaperone family protein [Methanobrevibacter sp. TMH8]|uniref:proteasome assembly chaperone family protein n=1 Tax=Methanobrevibacter sp. TMH8 TaxID=2848611 RepID=UPI001CCDD036|nr:proteasome assembly chaperone family protein [Methanobrevibacter sp. TMH8]MBZ9570032.1 proteasome assembly chaperone family protein [Methanobrevibacter sp. TMH8]